MFYFYYTKVVTFFMPVATIVPSEKRRPWTMSPCSTDTATTTNCANCGKAESDEINLKRCTACKMLKYCSRDCQVAHRPKHKKACKKRAAELFDEELFKDPPEGPECPICMLPHTYEESEQEFFSCCGKLICLGCVHAQRKEDIRNGKDGGVCAFCRTPFPRSSQVVIDRLNKGVQRNDAKSMEQLSGHYKNGSLGLQKDLVRAKELLETAGKHGCASAYGRLGEIYNEGSEKDKKKARHYWELGAIGGHMYSRYNLAWLEGRTGNERATKHFLICAKAGYEPSLDPIKTGFRYGGITKDEYATALKAYQDQNEERKSAMRDEALVYDTNPSLYNQIS